MKVLIILLFPLSSFAQLVAFGGAGISKSFSGELGLGYRVQKISLTAGYVSSVRADLPTYFNLRLNYHTNKIVLYGGYARETGFKTRHHPDLGLKVSLSNYQNGDIWIGAGYCGVPYAHIGFSWNLFGKQ